MLTKETKHKIDTLRDLLVGKIPNPQGQVQQITLALIYKFMSDIDDQTSGIFAGSSFFDGEFVQYKWTHLMDSKLSAQERLNLYAEGLEKIPLNPKVPTLFKSIFKQAFLPYRNPTTLTSFLKKIDEFEYEHSEDLGDAFEYLLSCLSAAGDAGMFRTPRHIIDFIVAIVDPQLGDTVLDPACGTAGFLISAYKHLVHTNPDKDIDFKMLSEKVSGYDISPDMVQLALVNLYLHNFPDPKIYEYDTLTSEDKRSERFDCILANPPFMTPKGGIVPHSKFGVKSNRSEVLFVDYIMEHLKSTGKAGIIVPEGVIFQSANAYKQLRKMLIEDGGLRAVVSLPAGVFNPYAGVKTSVLLLDKNIKSDNIIFAKITADGHDLGAQRREIEKNDLPGVLESLREIKNNLIQGTDTEVIENELIWSVSKETILTSSDLNLSAERYKTNAVVHTGSYEMVELGETISTITPSIKIQKSDVLENGKYPVIDQGQDFIAGYVDDENSVIHSNKPLVVFGDHTCAIKYIDFPFVQGSDGIKILETNEELNPKYLYHCLKAKPIESDGYKRHFSKLKLYKIPLPPLDIQEQIVAELDGYQAIIDGAKQIISNWKPKIQVKEEWEMVELGEVCDVNNGTIDPSTYGNNSFTYLDITSIENYTGKISFDNKVVGSEAPSRARRKVRKGDIVLSTVRPNLQAFGYLDEDPLDCIASTGFSILTAKNEQIDNKFIYRLMFSENLQNQMIAKMDKGAYPSINSDDVKQLKIPLPSLDIQQSIVAQIQHEQSLVDSAKELVRLYEQKVKERVERVWLG